MWMTDHPADEDYTHEVRDKDEENTRPTRQRKSLLHPRDKVPRRRHSPASPLNEQLHTPRPSQSPFATENQN